MSEPLISFTWLTGTMPFVPPRYWVEPRNDLRGRFLDYAIRCDAGVSIVGFETLTDAKLAARSAGIKLET